VHSEICTEYQKHTACERLCMKGKAAEDLGCTCLLGSHVEILMFGYVGINTACY
jgi:hypothetical protein